MANVTHPFEATETELAQHIEQHVDTVIAELSSFYLELPRGEHFVDYEQFKAAYHTLSTTTARFERLHKAVVRKAARENSLVLVVLRCIAGLSPPELADLATESQGVSVDQGFARNQDQKARDGVDLFGGNIRAQTTQRLDALIDAACDAIVAGPGPTAGSAVLVHRLDKVDTAEGLASVNQAATKGVEYAMLLYERLLGRPFATHRDSVSEKVGNIVEDAIADQLNAAGVPFHKTGMAERVDGFDQAPDFLIPDACRPKVVIEAKLTQDDGTARDKVTRIQHLDTLSKGGTEFEVIACIDGRGFKIRREDMKKLLLATRGKVFSVATMPFLVEHSGLKAFATKG